MGLKSSLITVYEFEEGPSFQAFRPNFLSESQADIMLARRTTLLDLAQGLAPPLKPDQAQRFFGHSVLNAGQLMGEGI